MAPLQRRGDSSPQRNSAVDHDGPSHVAPGGAGCQNLAMTDVTTATIPLSDLDALDEGLVTGWDPADQR